MSPPTDKGNAVTVTLPLREIYSHKTHPFLVYNSVTRVTDVTKSPEPKPHNGLRGNATSYAGNATSTSFPSRPPSTCGQLP